MNKKHMLVISLIAIVCLGLSAVAHNGGWKGTAQLFLSIGIAVALVIPWEFFLPGKKDEP